MDELSAPGSGDRNKIRDRIKRAESEGRISSADANIRLTNVDNAASMTELSLIARDLDQLEATISTPVAAPVPGPTFTTTDASSAGSDPLAPDWLQTAAEASVKGAGRTAPFLILGVVIALVVAGAIGLFVYSSGTDDEINSQAKPQVVSTPGQGSPGDAASPDSPVSEDPAYSLSVKGVRTFLAAYKARFGSTRIVEMVFYPEYVNCSVPEPKDRNSGWNYRGGEFSDFGGTSHNSPFDQVFDAKPLNAAAMIANLGRAKRVLKIDQGKITHVIVGSTPGLEGGPTVRIYVGNEFREGGYYTTTLGGKYLNKISY